MQFLKEAAKFVGDIKSLANEVDASLAKYKALELEIKRLLKAVVSQDIMIIVQNESVVDTSDLQTKLEHTRNPLSQKLENENVELEFQVLNYARENAHLKATYKNLFDSISVSRTQTKTIITYLQNELQSTIHKNAKLGTQLFKKVSDQKDNTCDTSANTKFAKQPIMENLHNVGETHALSKPVTSNSVSPPQESKGVNNDKVIAPGMFRINLGKTSREAKNVPNPVKASNRTKLITVSQPLVFIKKDVNSDLNGLSSTGVDNTKTRRSQPRSNTKNDRVPSASKSSQSMNKEVEVEEHHKNLLLSKNNKHISSACNNIKTDSQDVISKVVCAMCNKCLISINHDKCLRNYVNGKNSRAAIQGFGDLQWGNILITRVYFVEGLGHNLFFIGQFCDSDLEVANIFVLPVNKEKAKEHLIHQNLFQTQGRDYITSTSYGFVWTNENCQYKWKANDREDIGKLGAKGYIGFFIGYFVDSCAYRIYNLRTKKIMKTMNVLFDELSAMAFEQRSSKPRLQRMTSGQISLGLNLTYAPTTITTQQPSEGELDLLFEAMYDDYIGGQPSATARTVSPA
nr:integrase, catalytic region, zinc finger, CCHC-type, peptidase aspartic, catalytic [Tanacetum cinerariifolium]